MENYQSPSQQAVTKPARPVFLTVLCILTFIGSGWAIVSGISSYLTADATAGVVQAAMEDAKDKIDEAGGASSTMAQQMLSGASEMVQPENLKKNALFSIIASIFTLTGAVLMFTLKKIGYWLYILGTVISIAGPLYIFGGNLVSMLSTVILGIVGILFVILYGLNLKHMK